MESIPINELFEHLDKGLGDSIFGSFLNIDGLDDRSLPKITEEGLYQERLQSFIDNQLRDIQTFAVKEGKDYSEVRKAIAINHARFLFKDSRLPSGHPIPSVAQTSENKLDNENYSRESTQALKTLLAIVSTTLQKIHAVFSLDSMLLVVSPLDNSDAWLGGSLVGRDFWRGLRGGGVAGSRAFKKASKASYDLAHCATASSLTAQGITTTAGAQTREHSKGTVQRNSQSIKAELNRVVRQTLRYRVRIAPSLLKLNRVFRDTTKVKNAEMKWTKPHSLESNYGVRLVGWPQSIPFQNPSNNSMDSNRLLLEGFTNRLIKFVKLGELPPDIQESVFSKDSPSLSSASTSGNSEESRSVKRIRV